MYNDRQTRKAKRDIIVFQAAKKSINQSKGFIALFLAK